MNSPETLFQSNYPFPVYSLFTWRDQNSIKKLVYGFKGGWAQKTSESLATQYWIRYEKLGNLPLILVPAPARQGSQKDHALTWAEALFQCTNATLLKALQRQGEENQKNLDRTSRFEKKLSLFDGLEIPQEGRFVFVDDVITSGATAWAAYEALKKPRNFEVWTIGCRPRSHLL